MIIIDGYDVHMMERHTRDQLNQKVDFWLMYVSSSSMFKLLLYKPSPSYLRLANLWFQPEQDDHLAAQ